VDAAATHGAGHQGDPHRGQYDLDGDLDPVDPGGVLDAELAGDEAAQQGGHDADDDGEEHGDVLPARQHQPAQHADDGAHDDCGDDALRGHVFLLNSGLANSH
jgi:hypothetical protein